MAYIIRTAYKASSAPLRPVNFTAVLGSDPQTEVDMTWIEPFPADALVGYRIQRDGVEIVDLLKGVQNYTETGLTPGAQHSYTITSYSQSSESRPTQPPQVVTLEADNGFFIAGENTQSELGVSGGRIRSLIKHPTGVVAKHVRMSNTSEDSFYVATNGDLYGNGANDVGILGLGFQGNPGNGQYEFVMANVAKTELVKSTGLILTTNGNLYMTGVGFQGDGTAPVLDLTVRLIATDVVDMAVLANYGSAEPGGTFYIDINNDLYSTGGGSGVGLGLATYEEELDWTLVLGNVKSISTDRNSTMAVLYDGTLWGCGVNNFGAVGTGNTQPVTTFTLIETGVSFASAGVNHTMIVTTSGDCYGAGSNFKGELGLGYSGGDELSFIFVMPDIREVVAGWQTTGFIGIDTSLQVVGVNNNWQLGIDNGSIFEGVDIVIPEFIAFQVSQFSSGLFDCQMIVST